MSHGIVNILGTPTLVDAVLFDRAQNPGGERERMEQVCSHCGEPANRVGALSVQRGKFVEKFLCATHRDDTTIRAATLILARKEAAQP